MSPIERGGNFGRKGSEKKKIFWLVQQTVADIVIARVGS
jgi:hypothetical protein